jgi:DNA-binding GntR family transcriptional regulator
MISIETPRALRFRMHAREVLKVLAAEGLVVLLPICGSRAAKLTRASE